MREKTQVILNNFMINFILMITSLMMYGAVIFIYFGWQYVNIDIYLSDILIYLAIPIYLTIVFLLHKLT
jgi:hypothetical protein